VLYLQDRSTADVVRFEHRWIDRFVVVIAPELPAVALRILLVGHCHDESALVPLLHLMALLNGRVVVPLRTHGDLCDAEVEGHSGRHTLWITDVGLRQLLSVLHGDRIVPIHDRELSHRQRFDEDVVRARQFHRVLPLYDVNTELALDSPWRVAIRILERVDDNVGSGAGLWC